MLMTSYKNKRVLLFGLGLLGGGVATANWFIKQGAKVTITDLKSKEELAPSLKALKGKFELRLGKHERDDIDAADIIVLNPGVSVYHELIRYALRRGKPVINEATIFYTSFKGEIIGITGTRGKTTTTQWTAHLLKAKNKVIVAGNSPEHPFLEMLSKAADIAVTEMPSFQSELFEDFDRKPDIAIITNIFQDHFNRYKNYRDYVKTKAHLFSHQSSRQHLILNYDNTWTPYLLTIPHKSQAWFFSVQALPKDLDGIYWSGGLLMFQTAGKSKEVLDLKGFVSNWGTHNIENLMAAALAAHIEGIAWENIQARIKTLPAIPFRQEIIFESSKLTVVNDTTATSPEGCIAAVKRFGTSSTILITGGTDRELTFINWAKIIPNYIHPENIIMLEGSATKKMLKSLKAHAEDVTVEDTLKACVETALKRAKKFGKATILFSPASKSFEKFTNEFDRGRQFTALIKKALR